MAEELATAPALLTRKSLSHQLSCSLRTIDSLLARGMPFVLIGRRGRRFLLPEVVAWLKRKGGQS